MANNRRYRKIYWRFSSSSRIFRRIYIKSNRSHGNLVSIMQSRYTFPQRSGRNRNVLNYSLINTGAMINERGEINVTDERNHVTNEEVRNILDSGPNNLTLPSHSLMDTANVSDVDMNFSESDERNSNFFIQTDPMHQFLSTRNYSMSAFPTNSYVDSPSTSSVNGGREANVYENNFIFPPNRAVRNSSVRHRFTSQRTFPTTAVNAGDTASYMPATSEAPSTSNSRSENLEQTFVISYQGNEDQSSSAKYLTNSSNQAENSEACALVCPVCLEHFDKLLNNGDHFVAVTCGHVFCNKCADVFKGLRKCPKCRAYISARKILRLHF